MFTIIGRSIMREKTTNRLQMESLVLSPTSANQNLISILIAVAASARNMTFNQSICNYLISTRR